MEEQSDLKGMTSRAVGLQYGAILAILSIVLFLIPAVMGQNPFKGVWNWVGVGISIIVIVLAHKKFKDEGDGFMRYGQGIAIAFWIALVSTIISILFSYSYTSFIDSGPFELFMIQQEDELIAKDTPESIIKTSQEWTRKLFWGIGLIMGIIFTLLIALIITIFTKKQNPDQAFNG